MPNVIIVIVNECMQRNLLQKIRHDMHLWLLVHYMPCYLIMFVIPSYFCIKENWFRYFGVVYL